jgi:Flp pilus assembly pilin Flp
MRAAWRTFRTRDEGANLVEYALLVAVVAGAALVGLTDFSLSLQMLLEPVIDTLGGALP